ncbi:MAG: hypothetical protein HS117_08925 [Verrucomicrobiaceae bacterium]|jgi:plastocyanin|nr:hypothetical protein [Verrucomicrobiaceae bacterium]
MKRTLLICILLPLPPSLFAGGTLQGTLTIEAMKPAPARPGYVAPATKKPVQKPEAGRAIVYLERDDEKYPPPRAAAEAVIRQEGYQFRPSMLAVRTGTRVVFPNMDDEFHNVFSLTRPNHFEVGQHRKEEVPRGQVFKKAGVVKIYCDIHAHMRCFLVVLDTPWFTTTDAAGKFVLKDIPPGEYWLRVFQPSEKIMQQRVTVTEGKTTTANLSR